MNTLPAFENSIEWFLECAEILGIDTSGLHEDVCWPGVGGWIRGQDDIVQSALEPMVQSLIASGSGSACYDYLRHVGHRDDVLAALIASGNGWACCKYLRFVGHRDDVLAALMKKGEGK